jgi:NAD(P)-dependent dehydrogenase (short-subunit alcohol dehydrogenase family)
MEQPQSTVCRAGCHSNREDTNITHLACDKAASADSYRRLVDSVGKESPNKKIIPYPFNVAKEDETLVLIDEVLNAFGRLDVWVCSSGLLGPPSINDTTPDDLHKCFEAHSLAPFFALKYAPPAMAKLTEKQAYPNAAPKSQKYGSIVVISSVASTYGGCWGPCYTMMAHAALGVVRAGVPVLKGTGVRINCISPGQIDVGVDLSKVRTLVVLRFLEPGGISVALLMLSWCSLICEAWLHSFRQRVCKQKR